MGSGRTAAGSGDGGNPTQHPVSLSPLTSPGGCRASRAMRPRCRYKKFFLCRSNLLYRNSTRVFSLCAGKEREGWVAGDTAHPKSTPEPTPQAVPSPRTAHLGEVEGSDGAAQAERVDLGQAEQGERAQGQAGVHVLLPGHPAGLRQAGWGHGTRVSPLRQAWGWGVQSLARAYRG